MKNIKKLSLLLVLISFVLSTLSFTAFAYDDIKQIEENNKIYAYIPREYELSVFSNNLTYCDENGNSIAYCVGENKFAPEGIKALKDWQIHKVFEYLYLCNTDLESISDYVAEYEKTEFQNINGYSACYISGKYCFGEAMNEMLASYVHAYVFATKEDIYVVAYESIEKTEFFDSSLSTAVSGIVFNGTPFDGDAPEKNGDHDFSNSPPLEDVIIKAQENLMGEIFEDNDFVSIIAVTLILLTIVPTAVLVVIAIVLIFKYSKNKKKLKQYELTYGNIPQYNAYPQNYGGYGYNQPVNQPYQPPINPVYQQNPVNNNAPQTPSYVSNAVNNLGEQQVNQPTQPAQTNLPPEMQEFQNSNENKF